MKSPDGLSGSTIDDPTPSERLVAELVAEFLGRLRAGEDPDVSEYVLAHPEVAAKLEKCLDAARELYPAVPTPRTPGPLASGAVVAGRYTIVEELGSGASAVVYRATDQKLGREVALKVFRPGPAVTGEFAERFRRDARLAARLRHPNIVPLHDTGESGGLLHIEMALVRGETLEAALKRRGGTLSPRDSGASSPRRWGTPTATALCIAT